MKRIGILLVVLVTLAWIGSKVVPRSEPAAAPAVVQTPAPSAVAPAQASETSVPEPDRPLSAAEKKAQQERWLGARTIVAAERAVRNEP
ncbi:MAG: hypothetical protein LBL59_00530 [Xanthomonadaceae bacterium]|jgi:hypothetical protein|nr:hypothetical protein [Xanthomonadaceae bacterium]